MDSSVDAQQELDAGGDLADMADTPPPAPGTCPLPQGQQTHLEAAAASLAPGQACTLQSDLYGEATRPDKNYSSSMTWAASAAWIEPTRQLRWSGRAAGCDNKSRPFVHLVFDEQSNSWSHERLPTDEFPPCGHAYDANAGDEAGNYYFRLWRERHLRIRRPDGTWTKTPDHGGPTCCMSIAYMSSLDLEGSGATGGLIFVTGAKELSVLPQGASAWTKLTLPDGAQTGYHAIGEYSPTAKRFVFGGGGNYREVISMDPRGQLTHLAKPPVDFTFSGNVQAGIFLVADPLSGHFVVINKRDMSWFDFDAVNDRWTKITAPFELQGVISTFHATIPRHGVILFAEELGRDKPVRVWIYKHAAP